MRVKLLQFPLLFSNEIISPPLITFPAASLSCPLPPAFSSFLVHFWRNNPATHPSCCRFLDDCSYFPHHTGLIVLCLSAPVFLCYARGLTHFHAPPFCLFRDLCPERTVFLSLLPVSSHLCSFFCLIVGFLFLLLTILRNDHA
jgi:hypothetical protein